MKTKSSLRSEMRIVLEGLPPSQIASASQQICQHICDSIKDPHESSTIAIFSAITHEVDLSQLHQMLPEKELLYPLCRNAEVITFHHVPHPSELTSGMVGILEPHIDKHPEALIENIDLFLCPGLSFSKSGARLGYGGGYYDRVLGKKKHTSHAIGVSMAMQVLEDIPCEEHDVFMDYVLTEEGLIKTC